MKNVSMCLLIVLFALLSACEKEAYCEGIVGEWQLVEELMDPGDGSGTFQPVKSNKIVKFNSNGTFEANADMCGLSNQSSNTNYTGTYDVSTETFSPNNCMGIAPMPYRYSISGNYLILTFPCICGCQQKYKCL